MIATSRPSAAKRLRLATKLPGSPREVLSYEQLHYLDNGLTQVNPNYGQVTRYQEPMSARLGMVMGF